MGKASEKVPVVLRLEWKGEVPYPIMVRLDYIMVAQSPGDGRGCYLELKSGKTCTVTTDYVVISALMQEHLDVRDLRGVRRDG